MEAMTIIIPNYNKGPYIKDAIDSLLRQDVSNWRAIIMDDGSDDESRQCLERYAPLNDPRFSVHVNQQRKGKAYCMNRLVQLATTDIIGELDSDDALAEQCVKEVVTAYESSASGFIYTNFTYCDDRLNKTRKGWGRAIPKGQTTMDVTCVTPFRTFRKSAFLKTAGVDEDLTSAIDKDLIFKLEEVTTLDFIDMELYHYRELVPSLSRGAESEAMALANFASARARAQARRGVSGTPISQQTAPMSMA